MTTATIAQEAVRLIKHLPREKAQALLEYARYLVESTGEEVWEHRLSDPRHAKKLKDLGEKARKEFRDGKTRPLDSDKM